MRRLLPSCWCFERATSTLEWPTEDVTSLGSFSDSEPKDQPAREQT